MAAGEKRRRRVLVQLDDGSSGELSGCPTAAEDVGRSKQCEGCPGQAYCQSSGGGDSADEEKLRVRLRAIKRIVLVMSGKGGVGKSSVAAQLAAAAAKDGQSRVGLLDVDICGPSVARLFDAEQARVTETAWGWQPVVHAASGVQLMSASFLVDRREPIMWRGPRKTHLIRRLFADVLWGRLDWLFVDTPPGTSDEHLSVFAVLKSMRPDGAVLVTCPQRLSAAVVSRQITFCHKMRFPVVGVVENMAGYCCPCCGDVTDLFPADDAAAAKLAADYGAPLLASVPLDPVFSAAADRGQLQHTSAPVQRAIDALFTALAARIQ